MPITMLNNLLNIHDDEATLPHIWYMLNRQANRHSSTLKTQVVFVIFPKYITDGKRIHGKLESDSGWQNKGEGSQKS